MKDKILIEALQSYVVSLKLEIDDLKSQLKEKVVSVKEVQQTTRKKLAVVGNTKPIVVEEKPQEEVVVIPHNPREILKRIGHCKYSELDIIASIYKDADWFLATVTRRPMNAKAELVAQQCLDRFRDNNISVYELRKESYNMYTHTVLSAQGLICRIGRAIYHCGNEEERKLWDF
jgi:hypothetical protein|tara:strand:- start:25634 stop:26158 length:525 start_codon:yes stop_codon:yes gene_type:complete